ncbi:hypothetical protein AAFF_G00276750 [Aldrovandia affinis]|uniref:Uncharacterized protein n=1 Tax=Aldrovandia affinis TaxID=143900 RepID=A0AAD7RAQ2_9TELE|nr:hypothetical protein AAFF_G00276750 [Aldrovandia affinis]
MPVHLTRRAGIAGVLVTVQTMSGAVRAGPGDLPGGVLSQNGRLLITGRRMQVLENRLVPSLSALLSTGTEIPPGCDVSPQRYPAELFSVGPDLGQTLT